MMDRASSFYQSFKRDRASIVEEPEERGEEAGSAVLLDFASCRRYSLSMRIGCERVVPRVVSRRSSITGAGSACRCVIEIATTLLCEFEDATVAERSPFPPLFFSYDYRLFSILFERYFSFGGISNEPAQRIRAWRNEKKRTNPKWPFLFDRSSR